MIAINQDVTPQGTPVTAGDPRVWARKLSDGSTAFALINLEDDNMTIPTAALKSPCKAGPALVRAAGGCRERRAPIKPSTVCVLPLPGGPWIRCTPPRASAHFQIASRCELLRLALSRPCLKAAGHFDAPAASAPRSWAPVVARMDLDPSGTSTALVSDSADYAEERVRTAPRRDLAL